MDDWAQSDLDVDVPLNLNKQTMSYEWWEDGWEVMGARYSGYCGTWFGEQITIVATATLLLPPSLSPTLIGWVVRGK